MELSSIFQWKDHQINYRNAPVQTGKIVKKRHAKIFKDIFLTFY